MADQSQTATPTDVQTGPPPPPPKTPLDPPEVFYNKIWRVPPIVVNFKEDADALDPNEWETNPPATTTTAADEYPKLYLDVNTTPVVVNSADEEKALDKSRYREYSISESLIKSSQAKADAAQSKQSKK